MSERTNANYVIRIVTDPTTIDAEQWDHLQRQQPGATLNPFMRRHYLAAMHDSLSAVEETGWKPQFVTLWAKEQLVAACALYLKTHSYGEYVFDWAWANAYGEHGLAYYPKGLLAVPFTPVPGARLLAVNSNSRTHLLQTLLDVCKDLELSSLHLLFTSPQDQIACDALGLMQRQTVQFHWRNAQFIDFDHFLSTLSQEKRKKIKQERRRVHDAGVTFQTQVGSEISKQNWNFFYNCYERTYLEHGNAPYLSRSFFQSMQDHMADNWVMFIAERASQPIACSLIAIHALGTDHAVAYGRYWGALERVDCLHFEACYYQPLSWCIDNQVSCFEGGAQGEHKMARGFLPQQTWSAHWLAHPGFADAVERFLDEEGKGIENYVDELNERNPFKS